MDSSQSRAWAHAAASARCACCCRTRCPARTWPSRWRPWSPRVAVSGPADGLAARRRAARWRRSRGGRTCRRPTPASVRRPSPAPRCPTPRRRSSRRREATRRRRTPRRCPAIRTVAAGPASSRCQPRRPDPSRQRRSASAPRLSRCHTSSPLGPSPIAEPTGFRAGEDGCFAMPSRSARRECLATVAFGRPSRCYVIACVARQQHGLPWSWRSRPRSCLGTRRPPRAGRHRSARREKRPSVSP